MVETDVVEVMVTLPGQLFFNTQKAQGSVWGGPPIDVPNGHTAAAPLATICQPVTVITRHAEADWCYHS